MVWTVKYYMDLGGRELVADFIDSLSTEVQAKVLRLIDLGEIRVFYFAFADRRLVLLHGFVKKQEERRSVTSRLPKED